MRMLPACPACGAHKARPCLSQVALPQGFRNREGFRNRDSPQPLAFVLAILDSDDSVSDRCAQATQRADHSMLCSASDLRPWRTGFMARRCCLLNGIPTHGTGVYSRTTWRRLASPAPTPTTL